MRLDHSSIVSELITLCRFTEGTLCAWLGTSVYMWSTDLLRRTALLLFSGDILTLFYLGEDWWLDNSVLKSKESAVFFERGNLSSRHPFSNILGIWCTWYQKWNPSFYFFILFSENVPVSGSHVYHVATLDRSALFWVFSGHTWNSADNDKGIAAALHTLSE